MNKPETTPDEVSIRTYAEIHNISTGAVYYRIRSGAVQWRYLLPDTKEYIVIKKDSYVQKKIGRKQKKADT